MKKSIFYSWQSDLPNSKNRGFIENCIKKAIEEINLTNIIFNVAIDRDTKNISGTPDIATTIFSKIDTTSIFIADISFINPESKGRKTPNPNVLIELGYAAKTIGWENIICVFNEEFGRIEELPFDLRFRRPLSYKIKNQRNKSADKEFLKKALQTAIEAIIDGESEKDEIRNYIKQLVDKEIATICNHSFKILFGYEEKYTLDGVFKMLNLNEEAIRRELFERKFLGFSVLKNWENYKTKIESIMNQAFFTQNAEPKYVSSLIKVVRGLEVMASVYLDHQLFNDTGKKADGYEVVEGKRMNKDNPADGYLLLRKKNEERQGIVIDFGSIKQYNVERLLNYQVIEIDKFWKWTLGFNEVFRSIENWLDNTGNYLILDPLTFRTN